MQIFLRPSFSKIVLTGAFLLAGAVHALPQDADEAGPDATPAPTPVAEEALPPLIPEPRSIPGVPDEVLAKVDVFFALLSRGRIDPAYDSLVRGTVIEAKPADVEVLKKKTREALALFGKITGHDIADIKPVGDRLIRVTSLSFGESYPLRWRFYFYRSKEQWRLIDIRVDDRLADLFNENEPSPAR